MIGDAIRTIYQRTGGGTRPRESGFARMKQFFTAAVALLVVVPSFAQAPKAPDADIKKLADTLGAYLDPKIEDDFKKKDAAKKAFAAEFERIEKTLKPATLLAMPDTWTDAYDRKRVYGPVPSGLGRVSERKIPEAQTSGVTAVFGYALLLPNGYDVKKRYPLIVALHDKGAARDREVNGAKYLEEVWMKLPKEERDQFIIIAPNLGTGALGKDFRVEWGTILQLKAIFLPLREMLSTYPIDFDRVYLEGTGEGGEVAWHFALTNPHYFAAVAVRECVPKFPQVLRNGGSLPIAAHFRTGSPAQTSPVRGVVDQQKTALGLPFEIKDHAPADKPVKSSFHSDILPEATSEIAAFLAGKKRNLAPKKLSFAIDTARQCYWIRLGTFINDANYGTTLKADVDPGTNTIAIETQGVENLRVLLNDRVLNLDQPVKITVNGKAHTERQVTRSIDVLLKHFGDNTIDPGFQPTAIVEIKIPAADAPESAPTPPK